MRPPWYVCTANWYICTSHARGHDADPYAPSARCRTARCVARGGAQDRRRGRGGRGQHRRVAEVADLPLASTTYYFESKEHLLTAALELAAERDIARLHEFSVDAGDGADPLELAVAAVLDPIDDGAAAGAR